MDKVKIVLIVSAIALLSLGIVYLVSGKEDKPKAVSKLEQYQKELKEASDQNSANEQGNVTSDHRKNWK